MMTLAFKPAVSYSVGLGPEWATVADFNEDGKPDIVVTNNGANTVSVLLGRGDGTFAQDNKYTVNTNPWGVATADFNGDAKPDIVAVNGRGNTVSILLGHGDGTFAQKIDYQVGSNLIGVAVGDLNKDTKLDIVVTNNDANTVSILLGNGNGSFTVQAVTYPVGSNPAEVAVADFNGDAKLDLVTANMLGTASILLGKGDGTFDQKIDYQVGLTPIGIAAADFNRDAQLDVVAANSGGNTVSILLGRGNESLATGVFYPVETRPYDVSVADFNGDKKLDVVTVNYQSNTVSILLGRGDGSFAMQQSVPAGLNPTGVITADFNGDGKPDIATTNNGANTISILLNETPTPTPTSTPIVTLTVSKSITATTTNLASLTATATSTTTDPVSQTVTSTPTTTNLISPTSTATLSKSLSSSVNYHRTATDTATPVLIATAIPILILDNITSNLDYQSLAQIKTVGNATAFTLSRDNMLAAVHSDQKITLLNIQDPKNPIILSTIKINGSTHADFSANGKILYVANGDEGLKVIDLRNPSEPIIQNSNLARPISCVTLSPEGTIAYLCSILYFASGKAKMSSLEAGKNISIFLVANISDPINPRVIGSMASPGLQDVNLPNIPQDQQQLALLSNGAQGISIVDISNNTNPNIIGSYDTKGSARNTVFLEDKNHMYIADSEEGLAILQMNRVDPYHIKLIPIQIIKTLGIAYNIYLNNNATRLFLSDGSGGTKIFGIQAHAPYLIYQSTINTSGTTFDAIPSNNTCIVYIAEGESGFRTVSFCLVFNQTENWKDRLKEVFKIAGPVFSTFGTCFSLYRKKGLIKNVIFKKEYTKEDETINYPIAEEYKHIPIDRKNTEIEEERIKVVRALREVQEKIRMECCLPQYLIDSLKREALLSGHALPPWLTYDPSTNRIVVSDELRGSDIGHSVIIQIIARDDEILEEFRLTVVDEEPQGCVVDPSDVRIDEVSIESMETSSAEQQASYFMAHVQHHNPLLNDEQCFQLFQIAHTHAGMQGIDALINIGEHPETYGRFQALRSQIGDKQAVALYLGAGSGASSTSPTAPDSPISSDLHLSFFVVLGLIEHKGAIQYLWYQQIQPIAPDHLIAWVNLIPAPTVAGSTALGWTGLHFALSTAVYFKSNPLLAIAAQSASFGIKEMLIEQRAMAIHSGPQAEHWGECLQTHYPLFIAQALSSALSAWSSTAIAPIRLPHALAGATLQVSLTALQCCGSKEDPSEITLTQQILPYLVDLGVLGTLILKTPIYAPAGVMTHYGFMALSAVAVADQVSKLVLSWVPDEVFKALEQPFTWLLGDEENHEVEGDVSLDAPQPNMHIPIDKAHLVLPYCEINEIICEIDGWNTGLAESDLTLLTEPC